MVYGGHTQWYMGVIHSGIWRLYTESQSRVDISYLGFYWTKKTKFTMDQVYLA